MKALFWKGGCSTQGRARGPGSSLSSTMCCLTVGNLSSPLGLCFLGLQQSKPSRVFLHLTLMLTADTLGWGVAPVLPASPVHLSAIASLEFTVGQAQRPGEICLFGKLTARLHFHSFQKVH